MSPTQRLLRQLPAPLRRQVIAHREAVKFLITGGFCFGLTVAINYLLKLTILHAWPVTALTIATVISLVVSYQLNRQWSFKTRGGRRRHHEVFLFFVVSGVGVALNVIPLYLSRYAVDLRVPDVSRSTQEIADFVSGNIIGTALAMVFRLWAMKRVVFPDADARAHRRRSRTSAPASRAGAPATARSEARAEPAASQAEVAPRSEAKTSAAAR